MQGGGRLCAHTCKPTDVWLCLPVHVQYLLVYKYVHVCVHVHLHMDAFTWMALPAYVNARVGPHNDLFMCICTCTCTPTAHDHLLFMLALLLTCVDELGGCKYNVCIC